MNKPDLMDLFFSELQPQRMTMEDFFVKLADMDAKEFIEVFSDLLERWGKGASHLAFDLIKDAPLERDRVTKLVRLATKCAALQQVFDAIIAEKCRLIEPPTRVLERNVREAYDMMRRHNESRGNADE